MKTAASVTLAGNFAIAGSCLTLTTGALFGLQYLYLLESALDPSSQTIFLKITLVLFVISFWGLVSGLGVIRLKPWARISILILACLLMLFGLFAIFMLRMPVEGASDPTFF